VTRCHQSASKNKLFFVEERKEIDICLFLSSTKNVGILLGSGLIISIQSARN
jgi:hypothetical protein